MTNYEARNRQMINDRRRAAQREDEFFSAPRQPAAPLRTASEAAFSAYMDDHTRYGEAVAAWRTEYAALRKGVHGFADAVERVLIFDMQSNPVDATAREWITAARRVAAEKGIPAA